MKTTLDLDDKLLSGAKVLAAKRRTTLKALVEHALRRELAPAADENKLDNEKFEIGPLGLPVLKRRPGAKPMTPEEVRRLEEAIEEEDAQKAIKARENDLPPRC